MWSGDERKFDGTFVTFAQTAQFGAENVPRLPVTVQRQNLIILTQIVIILPVETSNFEVVCHFASLAIFHARNRYFLFECK